MSLISDYENAKQAIYEHVGFVEDWVTYPIDDCTEYHWYIENEEIFYGIGTSPDEWEGDGYFAEVYKQRFYSKHIYQGEEYTLVFTNPRVDGMKYFGIFKNSKCLSLVD